MKPVITDAERMILMRLSYWAGGCLATALYAPHDHHLKKIIIPIILQLLEEKGLVTVIPRTDLSTKYRITARGRSIIHQPGPTP